MSEWQIGRVWRNDGGCIAGYGACTAASDTPNPHGEARTEAKGVSGSADDTQGLKARCEALIRHAAVSASGHTQQEAQAIVALWDVEALITDLMAQDLPERDKLAKAYEAGRNTPA